MHEKMRPAREKRDDERIARPYQQYTIATLQTLQRGRRTIRDDERISTLQRGRRTIRGTHNSNEEDTDARYQAVLRAPALEPATSKLERHGSSPRGP